MKKEDKNNRRPLKTEDSIFKTDSIIEFKNVIKSYDENIVALNKVNFSIKKGEE
jgi:ABC-type multidrug transport system fused ATPase/permease subunit